MHILYRGAEAILYRKDDKLVKERIRKSYRLPQLDIEIRKRRTRQEAKLLLAARRAGIKTPRVFEAEGDKLEMEFIEGKKLKDDLNDMEKKRRQEIAKKIGLILARLHETGIVHGDLTTSNMLLKDSELFLVDFGLGKFSNKIEEQAVDLYLLYEAMRSVHFKIFDEMWKIILKIYSQNYTNAQRVLKRFEEISKRRRYA